MAEKICTLFCEHGITVFSILAALSMTISTIVFAIPGALGGGGVVGVSPPKGEGVINKWLNRLADALKKDLQKRLLKHYLLLWEVLLASF